MMILPVSMQEAKDKADVFFIEIYKIELRTQDLWIAACDEDIDWAGVHCVAIPIKRGPVTRSMDGIVNEVDLEIGDCSDELLDYVMSGFDFRGCRVTIGRILYPDSLENNQFSILFVGEIDKPNFSNGVFTCKVETRLPHIDAPCRDFQCACNSEYGDVECGLQKEILNTTISNVSGNRLSFAGNYPKDHWKFGTIQIEGEVRNILYSDGNYVAINANFLQPINGKPCQIIRGCNKTMEWCDKKFNNAIHYTGFPAIPWESEYR